MPYPFPEVFYVSKTPPKRGSAKMKRQLLVRGSAGIGGATFSAGTFWSMAGTVVDGAAGAIRGAVGGLNCAPPWPVVVGGFAAVLLEGGFTAKKMMPTTMSAATTTEKIVPTPTLPSEYRGGFRPNPGSGSFGSRFVMCRPPVLELLLNDNAQRARAFR